MMKKTSLIALGITDAIFSRVMLLCIDDPEGPNLLVVTTMALIVFGVSLLGYRFIPSINSAARLLTGVLIQVLFVTVLYFLLR